MTTESAPTPRRRLAARGEAQRRAEATRSEQGRPSLPARPGTDVAFVSTGTAGYAMPAATRRAQGYGSSRLRRQQRAAEGHGPRGSSRTRHGVGAASSKGRRGRVNGRAPRWARSVQAGRRATAGRAPCFFTRRRQAGMGVARPRTTVWNHFQYSCPI